MIDPTQEAARLCELGRAYNARHHTLSAALTSEEAAGLLLLSSDSVRDAMAATVPVLNALDTDPAAPMTWGFAVMRHLAACLPRAD